MEKVKTQFGEVEIPVLIEYFEKMKLRSKERSEWMRTEEGKQYNRLKAKEFYQRNRDKILEQRKNMYEERGELINQRNKAYYHRKKMETTEA